MVHEVFFTDETPVYDGDSIEQNVAWLVCSKMANKGAVTSDATTALLAPATLAEIAAASAVANAASLLGNKLMEASSAISSFAARK